jgi:hypothetical protein
MRNRETATSRDARAGCFTCHGTDAHWIGAHAQGTAARHHDLTGHATWCDIALLVRYGRAAPDSRQYDLEAAIAQASPESDPMYGGAAP